MGRGCQVGSERLRRVTSRGDASAGDVGDDAGGGSGAVEAVDQLLERREVLLVPREQLRGDLVA